MSTQTKQVRESELVATIRTIVRSGRQITYIKYNGQPTSVYGVGNGERYVLINYTEPSALAL